MIYFRKSFEARIGLPSEQLHINPLAVLLSLMHVELLSHGMRSQGKKLVEQFLSVKPSGQVHI